MTTTCLRCRRRLVASRFFTNRGKIRKRICRQCFDKEPITESDISRFMSFVNPKPTSRGCLLWTGGTARHGYGNFFFRGRMQHAHRVSWLIAGRLLTSDKPDIRHECDTPACVNVDHLCAGTTQENMTDMAIKGRGRKGTIYPPGVSYAHSKQGFIAYCRFNNIRHHLGTFKTVKEAAKAVSRFKQKVYSACLQ